MLHNNRGIAVRFYALRTRLPGISRVAALVLAIAASIALAEAVDLPVREIESSQFLLRRPPIAYDNFALHNFENYPNHSSPYRNSPTAVYDAMGNYLITGYPLYEWIETRKPGQNCEPFISTTNSAGCEGDKASMISWV